MSKPHSESAVVSVRGITHRFGKNTVLRDLDMDVPEGSVTAILGRNGVGKSTLLRILVGFFPATAGSARVLGLNPRKKGPKVREKVGYVPERLELPPWMTVGDHMRFLEPFYATWNREEERRLLDVFTVDPNAKVKDLSKGGRVKHALVAALAHEPRLLLLDEPFSGLDPVVRQDVLTAVLDHLHAEGRTVLLVSHSIADIERVSDRIVLLRDGTAVLDGDLEDIQRRTMRLMVTLKRDATDWAPPGDPQIDRDGDDALLTYLDWKHAYEPQIQDDSDVRFVRRMPRDLNDIFLAILGKETGQG